MILRKLHNLLSFNKLLKFLFGFAFSVQLVVITYNHFTGYLVLESLQHFISRLIFGTVLSLLAGFLLAYPDLYIIRTLNKKAPWKVKLVERATLQLLGTVLIALTIALGFTYFSHWISPYAAGFSSVAISNALIFIVVNIILMVILEAWINYLERDKAQEESKHLQKELSQIKFEVLKSQINPHFMFNSLNVLSGLIGKDPEKAERFIDEFSQIYRYVLETIEQPVATLSKELEFMRSYLFLQQIRYGDSLLYSVNIPAKLLLRYLPPLSLQVVLENAIKHNVINETNSLQIDVFTEGDWLVVKNNMKPKTAMGRSTHLGLKNLSKRYAMITDEEPEYMVDADHYIAKLPLIESPQYESTDN